MKKGLKAFLGVLVILYILIAILTTTFLIKRNDYGVVKIGDKSYFLVENEELGEEYDNHTLIVVTRTPNSDINVGDNVFYYDTYTHNKTIKFNEVTKKEDINENETTFTTKDNSSFSSSFLLGSEENMSSYVLFGKIFFVLQSRWGFLFLIIFPLLLAFLYEIYALVKEVKGNK